MSLENTARVMGFTQLEEGVYKGKVNNIYQEIRLLKAIVNEYKLKPIFRQLAVKIINSFPCQHKNYDCYVYAIAKWIRDNIKYVKDIKGYETLQTPDNTLKIGGGDCDDHALLAATLFESIGMKTYFKIVGEKGKYKHIYVVVKTPKGKVWAVDTTEPNFFYPIEEDNKYENEILEELGELGWGFHPFKAIRRAFSPPKKIKLPKIHFKPFKAVKRATPKVKIKVKPKKFIKRATGGIRHPKRFLKDIKKKPLAFANKRFRQIIPKPIKFTRRAFSPVIKPIEHQAHKIEKISPLREVKIAKFLKRATASKSIDEAGIKVIGAVLAAKAAAGAMAAKTAGAAGASAGAGAGTAQYASMQAAVGASTGAATAAAAGGAGAGLLSTIGSTAGSIAAGVGTTLATNYIANKISGGQQQEAVPQQVPIQQEIPAQYQQEQNTPFSIDPKVFKNPVVLAAGILALGLILRR